VSARRGSSERTVENQLFRGIKPSRRVLAERGVTTLFADEE
jgi:hypothetical protein